MVFSFNDWLCGQLYPEAINILGGEKEFEIPVNKDQDENRKDLSLILFLKIPRNPRDIYDLIFLSKRFLLFFFSFIKKTTRLYYSIRTTNMVSDKDSHLNQWLHSVYGNIRITWRGLKNRRCFIAGYVYQLLGHIVYYKYTFSPEQLQGGSGSVKGWDLVYSSLIDSEPTCAQSAMCVPYYILLFLSKVHHFPSINSKTTLYFLKEKKIRVFFLLKNWNISNKTRALQTVHC